jgi:hypothetical protein
MKTLVLLALMVSACRPATAVELSLNQRLIVACFKLQVDEAVTCLRQGASVNARFGQCDSGIQPFLDRWTGGTYLCTDEWTPLIALASSSAYPDPPTELGKIWKDSARSRSLRDGIAQNQIDKRRSDTITILLILLSHGCKLDCDDGNGATALFRASETDKVAMAKVLLQFGANPNTKTQAYIDGADNITPLHVACRSKELMQLLLAHGADASVKDSEGQTPADWVDLDDQRDFDLVTTPDGPRVRPREKTSTKASASENNDAKH